MLRESILQMGGVVQVKSILLALTLLCLALTSHAQTISVADFRLDVTDLTANSTETQVLDQNGDKCALIRVQTIHKGFYFDVGSLGIQKVEEDHIGEIWVYVSYGTRHISIRHPQLGSLPYYDFPVSIQKARTYIMVISSDAVIAPSSTYDSNRAQKLIVRSLPNASITINGRVDKCNDHGEIVTTLAFGTYSYKIEIPNHHPKEGVILIDNPDTPHELEVKDFQPRVGYLTINTNAVNPTIFIDDKPLNVEAKDGRYPIIIGQHKIEIHAKAYEPAQDSFEIKEDETTALTFEQFYGAVFEINSKPKGIQLTIDGKAIGITPVTRRIEAGTHRVQAQKERYQAFDQDVVFDSVEPKINIKLLPLLNYKTQFYLFAHADLKPSIYIGVGTYIQQFNAELSYTVESTFDIGPVYWESGGKSAPISSGYHQDLGLGLRLGYGLPLARRFRITPQAGMSFIRLKASSLNAPINGPYNTALTLGANMSCAIFNHFAIVVAPEYYVSGLIAQSRGYELLKKASADLDSVNNGFYLKFGFNIFF